MSGPDDLDHDAVGPAESPSSSGIPHLPTSEALEVRTARCRAALSDASSRFEREVVGALVGVISDALYDASATLVARLEFLERQVAAAAVPQSARAELHGTVRDVCRWLRVISQRAEARAQAIFQLQDAGDPIAPIVGVVEELGTISVPLDHDLFLPEPSDGVILRVRKSLFRRTGARGAPVRGVPLTAIGRAVFLPRVVAGWHETLHRVGALRVEAWRRQQLAVVELLDGFQRLDDALAKGGPIAWSDVRRSLQESIEQVRLDVGRFAAEIVERRALADEEAMRALEYAAARSGTFLLPDRAWSHARPLEPGDLRRVVREFVVAWNRLGGLAVSELAVLLDGHAFVNAVRYALYRDSARLLVALRSEVGIGSDAAVREIRDACALLGRDGATVVVHGEEEELNDARTRIHEALRRTLIGAVSERHARQLLTAPVADLRRSVLASAGRVQGTFEVSDAPIEVHEGDEPPLVEVRGIELRSRARVLVVERLLQAIDKVHADARNLFARAEDGAREVAHIVDFLFEAAREDASLDDAPDRHSAVRRQFVADGLPRAAERAEVLVMEFGSGLSDSFERLLRAADTPLLDFEKALRTPRSTFAGAHAARSQVRVPSAPVSAQAASKQPLFGSFATTRVTSMDGLASVLRTASFGELESSPIPENYWRLFSTDGAVSGQLRVAHVSMLERFRDIVSNWEHGDPESVALIGVNGTGKASVVDQLLEHVGAQIPTLRVRLRERLTGRDSLFRSLGVQIGLRAPTLESLVETLAAPGARHVVVLEAAERLFLRHPSGLDALHALLSLISATAERVLWIVTFEKAAFDFLTNTLEVSEAFTNVLEVPLLTRAEVEGLVLLRHRMSGFRLRYDGRALKRPGASEEVLRSTLFDRLYDRGSGHPTLTLFLWLTAIREVSELGEIVVGMPAELPGALLSPLAGRKCAALGALMLHGGLDRNTLAQVMRISSDEAGSLLGQLRHLHLVETRDVRRGIYRANRVAFLPLYRELQARNVL